MGRAGHFSDLQMLSIEMSRSCSYIDGWSFLLDSRLKLDWECSLITLILISPVPGAVRKGEKKKSWREEEEEGGRDHM